MTSDQRWQPCESGALRELADSQQLLLQHKRRSMINRRTFVGSMVAVVGGGLYFMTRPAADPGPLSCADVMRLADDYLNRTVTEIVRTRVDEHRTYCRKCDKVLLKSEQAMHA